MKLLSMSGLVPEQICDTVRFTKYDGEKNISHYCGYASDFISQVLNDNTIDGAIVPRTCDSSRAIETYIKEAEKFFYQFIIPQNNAPDSLAFLSDEIRMFRKAIETHYGIEIDKCIIADRIDKINRRNREIREIYKDIESLSFADYLRGIHSMLCRPLAKQTVDTIEIRKNTRGKRVYLIGSFLSNIDLLHNIENAGLNIVGDSLPESGRIVSQEEMIIDSDVYSTIAKNILCQRMSPTQNYFTETLSKDISDAKEKNAEGVIFITQQYCEAYDYYYSMAAKELANIGMPVMKLQQNGTVDSHNAKLSIEAFADIL